MFFNKKNKEVKINNKAVLNGCYDFNKDAILIDMTIHDDSDKIDFIKFIVPEKGLLKENYQCAYLEQYLNLDGSKLICDLYDIPKEVINPVRVAFFLYKSKGKTLTTPYGDFDISKSNKLVGNLKNIIIFEE